MSLNEIPKPDKCAKLRRELLDSREANRLLELEVKRLRKGGRAVRHIEYSCDICRDKGDVNSLLGFEFDTVSPETTLRLRPSHDTARHLCRKCARALTSLLATDAVVKWLRGVDK